VIGFPAQCVEAGPATAAAVDVDVDGVSVLDDEHATTSAHVEIPITRPRRIEELMTSIMMDRSRGERVVF
jgi:hypothetical protein